MKTSIIDNGNKEWKIAPSEKGVSNDKIIDAYLEGKKKGLELSRDRTLDILDKNIKRCTESTEKLLVHLKGKGITPLGVYMKINSIDDFQIITTVKEKDYLDSNFYSIYDFVADLEDQSGDKFFDVMFHFIDVGSEFDEEHLQTDGFVFKYKEFKKN